MAKNTIKPAIFLDRDGTMIEDKDYLSRPDQVVFYPGVMTALKRLQEGGFELVMVTNQSGVGRGYFTMEDVHKVHRYIEGELAKCGVSLRKIYVAPEAPDQPSLGRKPSPQFLFDARDELGVDLSRSYMIGDKVIDLECGWNAGVKGSVLVRTGYGREMEKKLGEKAKNTLIADGLAEAASVILHENC